MGVFKVFKQKTQFLLILLIMVFLFNKALAILPQIPSGSSGYYVIPFGTAYITAIFNNTKVCADANENLVCDSSEITTLNAGQYMSTTAKIIFTDKPVSVIYYENSYSCFYYLPLKKIYYTQKNSEGYIVSATFYTNVSYFNLTDKKEYNFTGISEYVIISPVAGGNLTGNNSFLYFEKSSSTYSNTAFLSNIPIPGKIFYTDPITGTLFLYPTANNTIVEIDENRDGLIDESYILNLGNVLSLSLSSGSKIVSNKPVTCIKRRTWVCGPYNTYCGFSFSLIPAMHMGSEYILPANKAPTYTDYYIVPIQYHTVINITNETGTYTFTLISPSEYIKVHAPSVGTKVSSNKPVEIIGYVLTGGTYIDRTSSYTLLPLSPSTIIQTPGLIGVDEYGTIKVRFFNPTSENLYNISLEIYTHKNFTLVGGAGIVNVTIYKKDANSDAILSQDFVQKSYSLSGEDNVFSVSYQDNSLLSVLQPNEYIEVVYKVISNHPGYYSFRVNSRWKATHWY